eukprot:m.93567 g.93567  ORF g.93567 m.93567 type:complete len:765 (-) comp12390_c0_seq1:116-2410(-)
MNFDKLEAQLQMDEYSQNVPVMDGSEESLLSALIAANDSNNNINDNNKSNNNSSNNNKICPSSLSFMFNQEPPPFSSEQIDPAKANIPSVTSSARTPTLNDFFPTNDSTHNNNFNHCNDLMESDLQKCSSLLYPQTELRRRGSQDSATSPEHSITTTESSSPRNSPSFSPHHNHPITPLPSTFLDTCAQLNLSIPQHPQDLIQTHHKPTPQKQKQKKRQSLIERRKRRSSQTFSHMSVSPSLEKRGKMLHPPPPQKRASAPQLSVCVDDHSGRTCKRSSSSSSLSHSLSTPSSANSSILSTEGSDDTDYEGSCSEDNSDGFSSMPPMIHIPTEQDVQFAAQNNVPLLHHQQQQSQPYSSTTGLSLSCSSSTPLKAAVGKVPTIGWYAHKRQQWRRSYDERMREVPTPAFKVTISKGCKYSEEDNCFLFLKKNNFQVEVVCKAAAIPAYVMVGNKRERVASTYLILYGEKCENPSTHVQVEQSGKNRRCHPLEPPVVALKDNVAVHTSVQRLHFAETTANNSRKNGRVNPDQRYFSLVVALVAETERGHKLPLISHNTDPLVVRTSSNAPTDSNTQPWKPCGQSAIFHKGNVGINMDVPDEALCVLGNIRLSGAILQPSDCRAKTNIVRRERGTALMTIRKLPMYNYNYTKAYAEHNERGDHTHPCMGPMAQDVKEILPSAVSVCSSHVQIGDNEEDTVDDFLVVDNTRLFMESVAAVKDLADKVEELELKLNASERRRRTANWMTAGAVGVVLLSWMLLRRPAQ